uniref:Uncharacterized protein n=1 Tax=Vitis vinifera TaxID=29760 RepID=F6H0U5_VITVI
MATAGGMLAEAYVMRKLHKEKMKAKAQDEEPETGSLVAQQTKTSSTGACFLGICLRKKVHPNFDGKRTSPCDSGII